MPSEFEEAVVKRLTVLIETAKNTESVAENIQNVSQDIQSVAKDTHGIVKGLDELNRNIEKLIKILVEKENNKK